ncbi:DUF4250 domain-containing protein [Hafnia paralvei]|uniref:DUF4250 domain-containing protein n=1 Tax=Hafnia paralvei TaxID=546367 RepID=UPI001D0F3141|nr:DUF4250 domain-containing protein [Hafnia paralvei]MCE9946828.1 DUF4250 domain-containing protein [Hafnia paralvei]
MNTEIEKAHSLRKNTCFIYAQRQLISQSLWKEEYTMPLSRYATMDPLMLMSIINMKLRDECPSLDDLARRYDLSVEVLQERLSQADYQYQPATNQFVQI